MIRCQHAECVDSAEVHVHFSGGERRHYCEFHARHVAELDNAEVAL